MAVSSLDALDLVLGTMAKTIVDNADYFAQLDSIVGDGDFGFSLRNGWEVVQADLSTFDHASTGSVLKKVGVTLAGKVGGVSGPIWGTAFLRAGATAGDKVELAPGDVIAILRAAIAGIMMRGGASLGEKTLLDALVPATDSAPEGGRRGRRGRPEHERHARHARPGRLHGRAQHRLRRRRCHRDRGHPPGHRFGLARRIRTVRGQLA